MPPTGLTGFPVLKPNLQISFHFKLQAVREFYLQEALGETVSKLPLADIDKELAAYGDVEALKKIASFGLRGEVFFPIPCILGANPYLLGYYRLLLGLSQKEAYNKGPFGRFKVMEERGEIPKKMRPLVSDLCQSLAATSGILVNGIDQLSLATVHDLQVLTLGPQLRGSENTRLGQSATTSVFTLIRRIAGRYVMDETKSTLIIRNEAKRIVMVEFSSDPDIAIREKLASGFRPLVSIEIKGGKDISNIHNRLGEAEKSHQKARASGFFEFWTIMGVTLPAEVIRRESPTTSRAFGLDGILARSGSEKRAFREMLTSVMGIKA